MTAFFDVDMAKARMYEIKAIFDKIKAFGRDVYIFGAGEYATKLKKYLNSKGIIVKGFFVDDVYASKMMLPLSEISKYNNISLVYGIGDAFSKKFYEKIEQIRKKISNCEKTELFVFSDFWLAEYGNLNHEVVDLDFIKGHLADFKNTYEMLADDLSRTVMMEYLYASVCHDASKLAQLGSSWDYDYDLNLLFEKCGDGVVIECGAFDGKTITEISDFTNNKYEMLALECDNDNYRKCCERTKSYPNINVVKLGAWDKKAKLVIIQNDSASFLKEVDEKSDSTNVVEVVDIDSLVGEKKVAALIMDIEGSELKALMGAQEAIKNGANLAVRVYHRKEDLITIPQYIKGLNEHYKFYIRYEKGASLCRTGDETTLYAICE